ncbi:MAG: ATP-binding cassette domain-containing protein, partial [Coprococcus sp.]
TLARMIVGLLEPDSGEIMYQGQNIGKISKRKFRQLRPQIQLIQQNPFGSLDPEMKIFDLLSEGIRTHHIQTDGLSIREYLTAILEDCGLQEEFLDRYPHEFSGGQLQRLAIARAIALRPAIVIADEIVSALDVSVQGQILDLLVRLKNERGMSVIFISHDLCVVRSISDKIMVMKDGEIVDSGSTEYIFEQSGCPYTQALKDAIVPSPYDPQGNIIT